MAYPTFKLLSIFFLIELPPVPLPTDDTVLLLLGTGLSTLLCSCCCGDGRPVIAPPLSKLREN